MALFLSVASIVIALFIIYLHDYKKEKYDELNKNVERGFLSFVIIFIDFLLVLLSFVYQNFFKIEGLFPLVAILICNLLTSFFIKIYSIKRIKELYRTIILSFVFSIIVLSYIEKDLKTFGTMLVYFLGFIISIKIYNFDFLKHKNMFKDNNKLLKNSKKYLCKALVSGVVILSFILLYYKISYIERFFLSYILWIFVPAIIVVVLYVIVHKICGRKNKS